MIIESEPAESSSEGEVGVEPTSARAGTGVISVSVPNEAKIYINDRETTSMGTDRRYVSNGLTRGVRYNYEVRAEIDRDGEKVVKTETVSLTSGGNARLAFDFAGASTVRTAAVSEVRTRLTVQVPEDATLSLAGNATKSTGATRTFVTTQLGKDDAWYKYTIKATVVRSGRKVSKEKTIVLRGGDDRQIDFDFQDERVAQLTSK